MRVASAALLLMTVWLGLTLRLDPQELALGAAFSLIVAFSTRGAVSGPALRLLKPSRLIALVDFSLYFVGQMVKANIDVLFRVLKPRIPVRPGIASARLDLPGDRARAIVANSITLTPGTLTVDLRGDTIFVHWISLPEDDPSGRTQEMVDGFARRLARVLG